MLQSGADSDKLMITFGGHHKKMDQITYENWKKIRDALKESGKTDSFFYVRACSILKDKIDPLNDVFSKRKDRENEEKTS